MQVQIVMLLLIAGDANANPNDTYDTDNTDDIGDTGL